MIDVARQRTPPGPQTPASATPVAVSPRRWPAALMRLVVGPAAGGALLFLSDHPVNAWPLQLCAFVPLLLALAGPTVRTRGALLAGAAFGLAYAGPLLWYGLDFPFAPGGIQVAVLTAFWTLFAGVALHVGRWRAPWGPLAVAAAAAAAEWLNYTAVPLWGTAQCVARVWSAAPWAVQFAAWTGVTGIVFAAVALQALVVRLATEPAARRATGLALVVLGALVVWADVAAAVRPPAGTLRVAAIGWTDDDLAEGLRTPPAERLTAVYEPLLARAVAAGARLVVSPEVGFDDVAAADKPILLARLADLARQHGVFLAVGYFDAAADENRVVWFGPDGQPRGEYTKTYLVPFVEDYRPGTGAPLLVDVDGVRVGTLVCQDDNFTHLPRAYARLRAQLVVVPSNDWQGVRLHHDENSRLRAVDCGFAVVRATSNGISSLEHAGGGLVAHHDHCASGPGVAVGDVLLRDPALVHAYAGEWFPIVCLASLAVGGGISTARRRRGRGVLTGRTAAGSGPDASGS